MSSFTTPLVVTPLADGLSWKLAQEFDYDVGVEGSGDVIRVPAGFVTDFASVPRALWNLFPPWGKYGKAAVVHDFLYRTQTRTRAEADGIFREAMGVLGVNAAVRFTMWSGVRTWGWIAWRQNQRKKTEGTS